MPEGCPDACDAVCEACMRSLKGDKMNKLRVAVLDDQVWFAGEDVVNMVRLWQYNRVQLGKVLEKQLEGRPGPVKVDSRLGEKVTEFVVNTAAAAVLLALADELDKKYAEALTSAEVVVK